MQESAKLRRGELIEEVKRDRHMLSVLGLIDHRAPSSKREEIATRINLQMEKRLGILVSFSPSSTTGNLP